MAIKLLGKPVIEKIKQKIAADLTDCMINGIEPKIAILRVGERPDDIAYEKRIIKNCEELNISAESFLFPEEITTQNLINKIKIFNADDCVHGIMIFRPLPEQIDEEAVIRAIAPIKDIDCANPINLQGVFVSDDSAIAPCTPEAVMEILDYYDYDLTGKNVTVVNRSLVLGKPLAMLLLRKNATVTMCHSKTKNLQQIMATADIVVTGVGRPNYFHSNCFQSHSVVIDVGINFDEQGMCGDVDLKGAENLVAAITPVPGGVGGVTSAILLQHVVQCMKLQGLVK